MDALDVTLCLARLMGLAPYEYIPNMTGGRYALNHTYRRLGTGVLLVIWVSSCDGVKINFSVDKSLAFERSVAFIASPAVFIVHSFLFVALLWWRQHPHLLEAVNLDMFRRLAPLGLRDVAGPILATATLVCGFVVVFLYRSASIWANAVIINSYLVQGSTLILFCVSASNIGLFSFLLSCVRKSIDGVNDSLSEMANGSGEGRAANLKASAIVALRTEHKEAVLATEKLCTAFGWTVFIIFLRELWKGLEISFIIFAIPRKPSLDLLVLIIDLLKSILPQVLMMAVAHFLTERANNTTMSSIHKVINSRRLVNDEVRRELIEFSMQIQQEPLVVSVSGMMVFNLPQLCQAFGIAATYVVILLQFRQVGE